MPSSGPLESDPRWCAIQGVLRTPSFARSARLSAFLEYIGRRAILGCYDEITEQQIGIHVFGREPDYNPGDDGIVRQNARQLRQRLALYYQEEGLQDPLRITVPRGSYIPIFEPTASDAPEIPSSVDENHAAHSVEMAERDFGMQPGPSIQEFPPFAHTSSAGSKRGTRRRLALWIGLATLALFGVILLARPKLMSPRSPSLDLLWTTLFQPQRVTFVVAGDGGMKFYTSIAHRIVSVAEYSSRSYLTTPAGQVTPDGTSKTSTEAQRRYTTMSDVRLIVDLLRLPREFSDRMQVVFARNFNTEELSQGNAIFIGAPEADPWVQLFDAKVDFSVVYGQDYTVLDRNPHANEPRTYSSIDPGGICTIPQLEEKSDRKQTRSTTGSGETCYSYAIISLTENPDQTGRVLLIEGPTMDQVEAARDFLFNPAQMVPVLAAARRKSGQLQAFDALLQTTSYDGGSLGAKLISLHLHP